MSIRLEHLNYVYSLGTAYEKHALKDISLTIPHGEFVGIIGHTGSGKSTLIQHLNGLIKATSGALYYNDENIYEEGYNMRELRNQVGLVFQYPEHQLFEIDVMTDVCFGPKNQGLGPKECKERALEALRKSTISLLLLNCPEGRNGVWQLPACWLCGLRSWYWTSLPRGWIRRAGMTFLIRLPISTKKAI